LWVLVALVKQVLPNADLTGVVLILLVLLPQTLLQEVEMAVLTLIVGDVVEMAVLDFLHQVEMAVLAVQPHKVVAVAAVLGDMLVMVVGVLKTLLTQLYLVLVAVAAAAEMELFVVQLTVAAVLAVAV
jgi:hypothetical protein